MELTATGPWLPKFGVEECGGHTVAPRTCSSLCSCRIATWSLGSLTPSQTHALCALAGTPGSSGCCSTSLASQPQGSACGKPGLRRRPDSSKQHRSLGVCGRGTLESDIVGSIFLRRFLQANKSKRTDARVLRQPIAPTDCAADWQMQHAAKRHANHAGREVLPFVHLFVMAAAASPRGNTRSKTYALTSAAHHRQQALLLLPCPAQLTPSWFAKNSELSPITQHRQQKALQHRPAPPTSTPCGDLTMAQQSQKPVLHCPELGGG